jgi:hypothetical protein
MSDLDTVLRLVAEGHLTPDEAAPIIEALSVTVPRAEATTAAAQQLVRTHLRIKVTERGRQVVNVRIPLAFADMAMRMVPGLSGQQAERIRAAVDSGSIGPIIDVEEPDGDAVLISVE